MTSPAVYENQIEITYVFVRMRDDAELSAKITRPSAPGPFPAIMEYNPYRRQMKVPDDYRNEYPPAVPYLAERGYAIVQFDVRGSGNSTGWNTDIYSQEEQQDAYDMVQWIADQPWCNGSVGMIGKSYGAVVQWQVAVQQPPALKAIIVRSANDDVYTEWVYPGGSLRPYMFDTYSHLMNAYNFAPPDPDVVGDRWYDIWQERLEKSGPWGIGYISNQLNGDYWQSRSLSADFSRVQCATFVVAGWSDCYSTALMRAYENLQCPKKALVGPWGHWFGEERAAVPGPRIDTGPIYCRWFDHWLKGIDTGMMDEPPVTLFVREYSPPAARMPLVEAGNWRNESEWPIARSRLNNLYFSRDGLSDRPSEEPIVNEFEYVPGGGATSGIHWGGGVLPWGMPLDQRGDDWHSLVYTSDVLEDNLEITGTAVAKLFVESTASVAYFRVKLVDVAPDGSAKLVRYGGLDATHRNSDYAAEPLTPGDVYELDVPLKTVSYIFAAGHRIRVMIAGADFQNAWPTPEAGRHRIHTGGKYPSHICLPTIPEQAPPVPPPELVHLEPAKVEWLQRPAHHCVAQDTALNTTSTRLHVISGDDANRLEVDSTFTVHNDLPAKAAIEAWARYNFRRSSCDVEVFSDETTSSDRDKFTHSVHLTIKRDGKPFFEKKWSVEVDRPC